MMPAMPERLARTVCEMRHLQVTDNRTLSRDRCQGARYAPFLVCFHYADSADMAPPKTPNATRGTIQGTVFGGLVNFTVRAVPLPPAIMTFLQANTSTINNMTSQRHRDQAELDDDEREAGDSTQDNSRVLTSAQFWEELEALCDKAGGEWVGAAERIWGFGPKRMGANLLLDPMGKTALRWGRF